MKCCNSLKLINDKRQVLQAPVRFESDFFLRLYSSSDGVQKPK